MCLAAGETWEVINGAHRAKLLTVDGTNKKHVGLNNTSVVGECALFWQPGEHIVFGVVDTELEGGGLLKCQSAKMLQFQGCRIVMTSEQCNARCHECGMLFLT